MLKLIIGQGIIYVTICGKEFPKITETKGYSPYNDNSATCNTLGIWRISS